MLAPTVTLRHATPEDRPFLAELFRACRADDFVMLGEPMATHMLRLQFAGQTAACSARFDLAGDHIITFGDQPIGRIWVHSEGSNWELVDIAVVPEHRNHGVASTLLRDLIDQADQNAATIYLDVRTDNAEAQRLYYRLGFSVCSATETDLRLMLRPSTIRKAQFEEFRRLALADSALLARLRPLGRDGFALALCEVASEYGYNFDAADVQNALRTARQTWFMRWV
jgi:ribosomal protein S18 acetylase RimI-like enzyme